MMSINKVVNGMKSNIDKNTEKIGILKSHSNNMSEKLEGIVDGVGNSFVEGDEIMVKCIGELARQSSCKKSFMLRGVPESTSAGSGDKKGGVTTKDDGNNVEDEEFAIKFMNFVSDKSGIKLGKYTFHRVSRYEGTNPYPRPIKFILKSELIVGHIFQLIRKILQEQEALLGIKGIVIYPDRTFFQRNKYATLKVVLNQRLRGGENGLFIREVRGQLKISKRRGVTPYGTPTNLMRGGEGRN